MTTKKVTLTEECWTIGSYLRSAAEKFSEIERECKQPYASQSISSLATTFENQKLEAIRLAKLFESADSATIVTLEDDGEGN